MAGSIGGFSPVNKVSNVKIQAKVLFLMCYNADFNQHSLILNQERHGNDENHM